MRRSLLVCSAAALFIVAGCKKEDRAPEPLAASPAPQPTPPAPPPAPEAAAPVAAQPTAAPPIQSAPPAPAAPAAKTKTAAPKTSASAPAASASAAPDAGKAPTASQGVQRIQACCTAINAAAKKGGNTQATYTTAATTCQNLVTSVKAGKTNADAAQTLIRAQLQRVPIPPGC